MQSSQKNCEIMTEGHKFRRCCTYLSTSASMKVLGKQTIAAAAHPLEVRRLALQQRRSLGQTTKAVDCGALSPLSPRTFTRIDMRVKHLRVHLSIESTVMPEASVNVRNHTVYLNIYIGYYHHAHGWNSRKAMNYQRIYSSIAFVITYLYWCAM